MAMSFSERPDYRSLLTPDAFVVYPSRTKLLALLAGAVAFCAVVIPMWNSKSIEPRIIAIAAWALFGLGSLFLLWKILKYTPSLIVNHLGVFDNSSAYGAYFLRWEEIDSIYIGEMAVSSSRQRFLAINLKDPDEFLSRQGALRAILLRASMKLVGTPVMTISANTLPVTLEQLISVMEAKSSVLRSRSLKSSTQQ
jgi:hypothetical protein